MSIEGRGPRSPHQVAPWILTGPQHDPMSTLRNTSTDDGTGFDPLVSAVDFNEGNYVRGRFDSSLAWYVQQIGRDRAPDTRSVWSHCIGVAGELVTAAYLDAEFNRTITDDYVGDDGYDLDYNGEKIEVKTVTDDENLELKISKEQVNAADYAVLARCSNPSELAELIGWVHESQLEQFGFQFPDEESVPHKARQLTASEM